MPLALYLNHELTTAGSRRATPGLGYLEALTKDNTRIVTEGIAEVVPQGVKLKSGETIELDSLICATGFDYSWKPRFPIYGRGGLDLREQWKDRPTGYLGLGVNNLPNYFGMHKQQRTVVQEVAKFLQYTWVHILHCPMARLCPQSRTSPNT